MKIVCIKEYKSQGLQLELTYGKIYDAKGSPYLESLPLDWDNYWIINDRDKLEYYSKNDFITLEEWRERKINELYD